MKLLIYFLTALVAYNAHAAPLLIQNSNDCDTLASAIKADRLEQSNMPIDTLNSRYRLVQKFSVGKGGAYVAIVEDNQDNNKRKVLKIFPTIATSSNKYNYRELFYSCLNSFISFQDLGVNIDSPMSSTGIFPRVYEIGMTDAENPNGKKEGFLYPYMISELIQGKSLTTLGKEAAGLPNKDGGYQLYKKDTKTFLPINKHRSEVILYQIVHLLYMLKRHHIKGKEYGFVHSDLNPGNVMVRNINFSGNLDAGFGKLQVNDVPLITFIDFGHSNSNLDDELGSKVKSIKVFYHEKLRFFSGSAEDFYKNLTGKSLSSFTTLSIGLSSSNADVRLYRIIARAIKDSHNYINDKFINHLKDCKTRTKCVEKAPKLYKASF